MAWVKKWVMIELKEGKKENFTLQKILNAKGKRDVVVNITN